MAARDALITYYFNTRNVSDFSRHALWLAEHHPAWPSGGMFLYGHPDNSQITAAWQSALERYPNNAEVLYHAGLHLEKSDGGASLDALPASETAELFQPGSP